MATRGGARRLLLFALALSRVSSQDPTAAPAAGPTWHKKGDPSKDCSWVADDAPDRCGWNAETKGVKGEDGSYASESCTACAWHKKGDPSKDCAWVADDAEDRCGYAAGTRGVKGEDGTYASDACPDACTKTPTPAPAGSGAPSAGTFSPTWIFLMSKAPTAAPTRVAPSPSARPTPRPTPRPAAWPWPAPTEPARRHKKRNDRTTDEAWGAFFVAILVVTCSGGVVLVALSVINNRMQEQRRDLEMTERGSSNYAPPVTLNTFGGTTIAPPAEAFARASPMGADGGKAGVV